MKPSFREQLGHVYGVHSTEAKAERERAAQRLQSMIRGESIMAPILDRLRMLGEYEHAEHSVAMLKAYVDESIVRVKSLRKAYVQGQAHGFSYGFIFGTLAGAVGVAGLLMLGIKVGP